MLEEEFIKPAGLTQTSLAEKLGVPVQSINLIVRGRRAITPEMALKPSRAFKNSAEFWLQLQMKTDLWNAMQEESKAAR